MLMARPAKLLLPACILLYLHAANAFKICLVQVGDLLLGLPSCLSKRATHAEAISFVTRPYALQNPG